MSGLAMMAASWMPWRDYPAGLWDRHGIELFSLGGSSGLDVGFGLLVFQLGLALTLIGFDTFRRGGGSPFRVEALGLSLLALLLVGAFAVQTDLLVEPGTYWTEYGFFVAVLASLAALVASARLRPVDEQQRAWVRPRRRAIHLLALGTGLWWLAVSGRVDTPVAPMTYAIALIALGVGLWPTRLTAKRLEPSAIGVLTILYGAAALGAVALADLGPELLEAGPIGLLLVMGIAFVLQVPDVPGTRPPDESNGRVDAVLSIASSPAALRVAALVLTVGVVVLVGVASLGLPGVLPHLRMIDGTLYDIAVLPLLAVLGAGLAIASAIAVSLYLDRVDRRS